MSKMCHKRARDRKQREGMRQIKSMSDADEGIKNREINDELKSFQSTSRGTQTGVFAGDEQQIKMADVEGAEGGGREAKDETGSEANTVAPSRRV